VPQLPPLLLQVGSLCDKRADKVLQARAVPPQLVEDPNRDVEGLTGRVYVDSAALECQTLLHHRFAHLVLLDQI